MAGGERVLVIRESTGFRRLAAGELPVRIGTGPGADIRLPGPVSGATHALVGLLDGRPFLQKADGSLPVLVNGEVLGSTRWLVDGDQVAVGPVVIRCRDSAGEFELAVDFGGVDYDTLPPEALARAAVEEAPAPAPSLTPAARRRRPGVGLAALFGGLTLLAALAVYLLLAVPVALNPEPAGARINVLGWPDLSLGGRWLLLPGDYQVAVSAEGHATLTAAIQVADRPGQAFPFRLARLPGKVRVSTVPPVPATVTVDGEARTTLAGDGPAATLELPAGPHALRIEAPRYQAFEQVLEVAGGGTVQELSVQLVPDFAPVTVGTVPAGAAILVDGETLGTTPATVEVAAGQRELRLELEGFKTLTRRLAIRAGEPQSLENLALAPADGLVRVISDPPGAAVTVAGRYRGVTPLETELAPGKTHRLSLTKPGYEAAEETVSLEDRRGATVRVSLAPRRGIVQVTAEPADAEVLVDGRSVGAAGQSLELLAVPHVIEVRKAGFETFRTEVTPEPGRPRALAVKLLTPAEAVVAAAATAARTAAAAGPANSPGREMRLMRPGSFRMGAPRREQGRRANETERDVRLTRPFLIGLKEVTNSQFRAFRPGHTSGAERYRDLAGGDRPVVMLAWEDAAAYCNWLSEQEGLPKAYVSQAGRLVLAAPVTTGYRLPTEAEWAWAARYAGGAGEQKYPWGEGLPPPRGAGNFADRSARGFVANVLAGYDDGWPTTAPVGQFTANAIGLLDLGGNVAEWVNDRYTVWPAGGPEAVDPVGPADGQYHVIRGSGWRHSSISELRLSYRDFGDAGRLDVGFRVARYPDPANGM